MLKIKNLILKNPITLASGTCGYGEELSAYYDLSELGAIFTKGISLNPREGNSGNRIIETYSGVMNSIGLENVGVEKFITDKIPFLEKNKIVYIPNIAGHSIEENIEIVNRLDGIDSINGYEINVSCPNVKEGGIAFGTNLTLLAKLTQELRKITSKALIIKLSPNVGDIKDFARCAEDNGADAVSAVNTYIGLKIDIKKKKPYFNNITAGLSGPAIKPMALRCVYEIYKTVKIPIIGMGGISNFKDALEFIYAGASVFSIGTMSLSDPMIGKKVLVRYYKHCNKYKMSDTSASVGMVHAKD